MKRFKVITFFVFLVAGILTLFGEDISKFNYACIWFMLMTQLFVNIYAV